MSKGNWIQSNGGSCPSLELRSYEIGNQSWFSVCGGSELSSRNRTSYKDRHAIPKEMISCSRRYSSLLSEESIRLLIFYDSNFHFYSLSNGGQEQQAVERKTASSFGNKFLYLTAVSTALSRRRSSVSCSLPRLTVQSSRPWLLSQLSPLLHCWISFSFQSNSFSNSFRWKEEPVKEKDNWQPARKNLGRRNTAAVRLMVLR